MGLSVQVIAWDKNGKNGRSRNQGTIEFATNFVHDMDLLHVKNSEGRESSVSSN